MSTVHDLGVLTDSESLALSDLHVRWKAARATKDYGTADRLRTELVLKGCIAPEYESWHPVFESTESRYERYKGRLA